MATDVSRTFQVDWNDVNSGAPPTSTSSARSTAAACSGPEVETPTATPESRSPASSSCSRRSSSTPVSSVALCTW